MQQDKKLKNSNNEGYRGRYNKRDKRRKKTKSVESNQYNALKELDNVSKGSDTKMFENEYCNIIKKTEETTTDVDNITPERYSNMFIKRPDMTRINKPSYDVWEYTYFKHIIELKDIFVRNMEKYCDRSITHFIDSDNDFFDFFSNFIRDCSSGDISPYVEHLNNGEESLYFEFDIKRNEE